MDFVLYSRCSCLTGRKLAEELGWESGYECASRIRNLVRWGATQGLRYKPEKVLNTQGAILRAINKRLSLIRFARVGLPVPRLTTKGKCLGRRLQHTGGEGFWVCCSPNDVQQAKLAGAEYFTQWLPPLREFRVHVIGKKALVDEKFRIPPEGSRTGDEVPAPFGEFPYGWDIVRTFLTKEDRRLMDLGIRAVKALGLDFGAVDIGYIKGMKPIIYEVNTAPSIGLGLRQRYAAEMKAMFER